MSNVPSNYSFDNLDIWIHILGIPIEYINVGFLTEVSKLLGDVCEPLEEAVAKWGAFVRIKVRIRTSNALVDSIMFPLPHDNTHSLKIQYEKLERFCSFCGKLGHVRNTCEELDQLKIVLASDDTPENVKLLLASIPMFRFGKDLKAPPPSQRKSPPKASSRFSNENRDLNNLKSGMSRTKFDSSQFSNLTDDMKGIFNSGISPGSNSPRPSKGHSSLVNSGLVETGSGSFSPESIRKLVPLITMDLLLTINKFLLPNQQCSQLFSFRSDSQSGFPHVSTGSEEEPKPMEVVATGSGCNNKNLSMIECLPDVENSNLVNEHDGNHTSVDRTCSLDGVSLRSEILPTCTSPVLKSFYSIKRRPRNNRSVRKLFRDITNVTEHDIIKRKRTHSPPPCFQFVHVNKKLCKGIPSKSGTNTVVSIEAEAAQQPRPE